MSKRSLSIFREKLRKIVRRHRIALDFEQTQLDKSRRRLEEEEDLLSTMDEACASYESAVIRESKREIKLLQEEIARLKRSTPAQEPGVELNKVDIDRAATLAFFDSLIFAIGNWSTDGQAAPDCELACQSVLFPAVYEEVMKQNKDYYITKVPSVALEIVKRGREFIKYVRDNCEASLVSQTAWDDYAPLIQQWWVNDALPLLYGARDPAWEELTPLTLVEMTEWRDMPASRALHFPLIFDGTELVKKHGDEIREFTGLPEFNKQQVTTRIEP